MGKITFHREELKLREGFYYILREDGVDLRDTCIYFEDNEWCFWTYKSSFDLPMLIQVTEFMKTLSKNNKEERRVQSRWEDLFRKSLMKGRQCITVQNSMKILQRGGVLFGMSGFHYI